MRPRVAFLTTVRGGLAGVLAVALPVLTAGCSDDPPAPGPTATPVDASPVEARDQLAALAAAAEDRHLTARYTYAVTGRVDRTVAVTEAADGTWRVDVPRAGADGVTDVAVAGTAEGTFQCALQSVDRPEGGCVRVADPHGPVPGPADPRVQHPFTDWREVLTDRRAPLSVSASPPLPGSRGACFAVESTSASLRAPMDPGIYCYGPDGTLTAVRADFGTLLLAGAPEPAPPTVTLPGPVVTTDPVPVA